MKIQRQKARLWWLTVVIAWIGFLVIAINVNLQAKWVTNFDRLGQQVAFSVRQPVMTTVFKGLAPLGTPAANLMICLAITLGLWLYHHRFAAGWVMLAEVGINILTGIFKMTMQRPRPINKLVVQGGYSFPSGHTTSTATMVLVILLILIPLFRHQAWRLLVGILGLIWLSLMGFDRIYLFVHYPTDVLAGLCLTIGWWGILRLSFNRIISTQQE